MAKKQGWYVGGKNLSWWIGKGATQYKKSFFIRKRKAAIAAARQRKLAAQRQAKLQITLRTGRANYAKAVQAGWVKKGGRVNFSWWANMKNVSSI